jgi:hypothetical protein
LVLLRLIKERITRDVESFGKRLEEVSQGVKCPAHERGIERPKRFWVFIVARASGPARRTAVGSQGEHVELG